MMLMLQRQCPTGGYRWRNVGRLATTDLVAVLDASHALADLLDVLAMRIVVDDARQEQIATWSAERGWRVLS
ncbi:MAG: hypothetical protein RJA55_2322 [Acidobacteriota bacterium]|jgi:hypothetical protein